MSVSKEEGATPPDQIIVRVGIIVPSFRLTVFGVAPVTRLLRIISILLFRRNDRYVIVSTTVATAAITTKQVVYFVAVYTTMLRMMIIDIMDRIGSIGRYCFTFMWWLIWIISDCLLLFFRTISISHRRRIILC